MNAVTRWFEDSFEELHPALQQLHRTGGTLQGEIDLTFGSGLAGVVGKRFASIMGVPLEPGKIPFRVEISHDDDALIWSRSFNDTHAVVSRFYPVGDYRNGYFIEKTGSITLHLTVDIRNGGWFWRTLAVYKNKLRIPLFLFPQTTAYKTIDDQQYVFKVELSYPLLGALFGYQGRLSATIQH